MNHAEYRALLGRLPIKNPTPVHLQVMCPHLSTEEVAKAFELDSVALPPLRVGYGCHVVHHGKEWVEHVEGGRGLIRIIGTKNHPAMLDYSHAIRTPDSFVGEHGPSDAFYSVFGMEQAIRFAEANWGDELVLDSWVNVFQTFIQDPTDLVNDRSHHDAPRTKYVLTVALNRSIKEIGDDRSKPRSELIEDAIVEMTVHRMVANELRGGRAIATYFHCAHCGHGLGATRCGGCKYTFGDDQVRMGMVTPLSKKMVAYLRSLGHVFKITPEVAWTKEFSEWRTRRS